MSVCSVAPLLALVMPQIRKAWETLRDPETRALHDAELACVRTYQELPIDDEVDLDDMSYDEATRSYSWPCRCAGTVLVTESLLAEGLDVFGCDTCSLTIRVLYDDEGDSDTSDAVGKS